MNHIGPLLVGILIALAVMAFPYLTWEFFIWLFK